MTDRRQGAPLSWRRVASTHSLEDLLLDASTLESKDPDLHINKSVHHTTRIHSTRTRILLWILGITSLCLGLFGLAFCFYMVKHCYRESTWSNMSCDSQVTRTFHRIVIQHGVHGLIVPSLEKLTAPSIGQGDTARSILQVIFGSNHIDDLISRLSVLIQREYPFTMTSYESDDVLYLVMLIPLLCGPVTLMAIAMNWFCMKIFKHNI